MNGKILLLATCMATVAGAGENGSSWTLPVRGDTNPDLPYLIPELSRGQQARPHARFVDANSVLTYGFATAGLTRLEARFHLANNFRVLASADDGEWAEILSAMKLFNRDRHDGEVNEYSVDLTALLPADAIRIRFADGSQDDGWGAFITDITLVSDAPPAHIWRIVPKPPEGFIQEWAVAGPFPGDIAAGLLQTTPVPDESALAPGRGDEQLGTPWVTVRGGYDRVSLLGDPPGFAMPENSVAYAAVFVFSPEVQEAELRAGSDDGLAARLNGVPVWFNDVHRGMRADQDRIPILLGKGWNRLLLKISNGAAAWEFTARIVGADGTPIPGVRTQVEDPAPNVTPFPDPVVPPRIVGAEALLDPSTVNSGDGRFAWSLTLRCRNIGGARTQPTPVRLLRGDEPVATWTVTEVPGGNRDVLLPVAREVWTAALLRSDAPLALEFEGQRMPLDVPEFVRFLAVAARSPGADGAPELRDAIAGAADLHRRWRGAETPLTTRRALARRLVEAALDGNADAAARIAADAAETPGDAARWQTSFQCAAPIGPSFDTRPDAVMVYGLANTESRVRDWRLNGYRTQLMTGIAWGGYQDYLYGRFDGKEHLDDAQHDANGERITHGGDVYYMVPTEPYTRFLCDFISKSFDIPVDGICLEEPEFWMRGGWSPAFKREWQQAYGEPWQAPDSSYEACWRAAALKKELYRRCLQTVCDYVREHRPGWERIVATHSLVNYANWGIASPESALATIDSCDTVIAQVWTDTIRTPCTYNGERAVRPFANAYIEFAQMVAMITPTGQSLAFLADPVADNAGFEWETCRIAYEATVAAGLLCPEVNRFEIMPWPDRVFKGRRRLVPGDADEEVPIPPAYATQLMAVTQALRQMPLGCDGEDASPLAVAVADSLMYERGTVNGQSRDFSDFFGLVLPAVQRGCLPKMVQMEHVHNAGDLKPFPIILLTYNGMKPPTPEIHDFLAEHVRNGASLVFVGDGSDPFRAVREWWNTAPNDFNDPAEHLFHTLGLGTNPQPGTHRVGKGTVFYRKAAPAAFSQAGAHADYAELVGAACKAAGKPEVLAGRNTVVMRRGHYVIAAGLTESVSDDPATLDGRFIRLFGGVPEFVENPQIVPGTCGLFVDIDRLPEAPVVAAGASRIEGFETTPGTVRFSAEGPEGVRSVTWLRLPAEPKATATATHMGSPVPHETAWHADSKLLRVEHDSRPDGIDVTIRF